MGAGVGELPRNAGQRRADVRRPARRRLL